MIWTTKGKNVAYDSEDSWQDVANYGTSETPSDFERRDSKHYNSMFNESDEPIGYVESFEKLHRNRYIWKKIHRSTLEMTMSGMKI
ncbi:hypothetical protein GCM10020331_029830 [Ectobacillus funiculus]